MTWRCCGTAGWDGSSPVPTPRRRLGGSCGLLRFVTSGSSMRSLPGSWSRWPDSPACWAARSRRTTSSRTGFYALLDVDDTIVEVHGYAKQGAGFGYSGVRGLNALLATLTT